MDKTILLASFIFPERVDWFLSYLEAKFEIKKEQVFCYKNLDDESKVIMTFRITIPEGKRLNLKDLFPSAIPIHRKGEALYTINALNKLIDKITDGKQGNIDYKSVKVDWDQYQNKLILINGNDLMFLPISKIF